MLNQKKLMVYFNNHSKYNEEEEEIFRKNLEKNNTKCLKIDVDHKFPDGALPIHYACLYNSLKYFMNLNIPHSQINIPGGPYQSTPMMFTICNSNYKLLLSLIINGADILQRNSRSSDVLSFCVRFDDVLGLILVLSFIEGNISINRYLRYSWKKNGEKTRNFLTERKMEIEGKEVADDKNNMSKFLTNSNLENLLLLTCLMLAMKFSSFVRSFAIFYFLVFYFLLSSTLIPLIFNIFYSSYTCYNLIKSSSAGIILYVVIYFKLISFLIVFLMNNSYTNINKIREAKYLISDLVLKDKYNSDKFCIVCINHKSEKKQHCDVCERCVSERIYHCSFLNKCITQKNRWFFSIYCVFSMVFYFYAIEFSYSKSFFEFLINSWVFLMFIIFFLKANFVFKTEIRYYNVPDHRTRNIETYPFYMFRLSTLSEQRRNLRV